MEKRVLAVHDVSCVGRCSLTAALPVISAAGSECAVLPTAVLSTQTGGMEGYTYRDLTDDLDAVMDHWERLGIGFDCIYSGFLGSIRQVDIVMRLIDRFGKDALIVVDPVMADFGRLYETFGPEFPERMRELCSGADLIIPNMTEAFLLLGREYSEGPYTDGIVGDMLKDLRGLGPSQVVLTGVYGEPDSLGAASYDAGTDRVRFHMAPRIEGTYHGSGDIFSSALVGAVMRGISVSEAADIAVRFTQSAVRSTYEAGTDPRFGILFERNLPGYMRDLGALRCSYRPSLRRWRRGDGTPSTSSLCRATPTWTPHTTVRPSSAIG